MAKQKIFQGLGQGLGLWTEGTPSGRLGHRTAIAAIAGLAVVGGWASQGLAQGFDTVPPLPAGAVPVPAAPLPQAPVGGQQYLIYVTDTSEAVLNQVRMVEPTAFRTTFQGRSVIQAGRFNMTGNAQQRITDLAGRGVRAEMTTVAAAVPSYSQTAALPPNVYASTGDLPPLPGMALPSVPNASAVPVPALPPGVAQMPPVPGNVEFGQELNYGLPPVTGGGMMAPPPTSAPPVTSSANAPFYVVIPTDTANLPTVSSQVIQLGTPPDRVQQRTAPRGPHVAVGPFTDRALANRWNDFFREAGLSSSRVHFQR